MKPTFKLRLAAPLLVILFLIVLFFPKIRTGARAVRRAINLNQHMATDSSRYSRVNTVAESHKNPDPDTSRGPEIRPLNVTLNQVIIVQCAGQTCLASLPPPASPPLPLQASSPPPASLPLPPPALPPPPASVSPLPPVSTSPLPVHTPLDTAIEAVTETEGTLTSGSVIALRITADAHWHGLHIPANTLIYGIGTLENERLRIRVRSIRMGDVLCSVSLEAYDLDGVAGIYVPGSLGRDAAKASADEAIGGLNTGTYDPALGGQAANAGIQTLKNLSSKKVREVRVTVPAGYVVLLK